jgi:S1-C subfamily serine protease
MRLRFLLLCATLVAGACAPSVRYTPLAVGSIEQRPAKDPSARVDVYRETSEVPAYASTIGEVRVSDTGFSMGCGYEDVLGRILDLARQQGADGVYLARISHPDMLSTCYRITARLLVYPERVGSTVEHVAPQDAAAWPRPRPPADAILRVRRAERNPSTKRQGSYEALAAGVIVIEGEALSGAGFLITRSGLALTNEHVVANQRRLWAKFQDGTVVPLRVIRIDATADVALVELQCGPRDCTTLELNLTAPEVGSEVMAIGAPVGLTYTLTRGVISALRRGQGVMLLQTDAAVNPGNSGGPLVDANGRVVGIVSAKVMRSGIEGLAFAVGIADALRVLGVDMEQ